MEGLKVTFEHYLAPTVDSIYNIITGWVQQHHSDAKSKAEGENLGWVRDNSRVQLSTKVEIKTVLRSIAIGGKLIGTFFNYNLKNVT